MTKKLAYLVPVVAALAAPSFHARAGGDPSPLVPPNSNAYGKSFQLWNVLYTQWMVETYYGGQTPSNTVGQVRFLPNNPIPGEYVFNVTLKPGTPFVAPPFPTFGETYDNAPPDDPNDLFIEFIIATAEVRVVLDGRVLMDDTVDNLGRYKFGTEYFEPPVTYGQPQPRGDNLNSTSAIWTQGIGAVYHPLPVGRHTLVSTASSLLGEYKLTYNITVTPH